MLRKLVELKIATGMGKMKVILNVLDAIGLSKKHQCVILTSSHVIAEQYIEALTPEQSKWITVMTAQRFIEARVVVDDGSYAVLDEISHFHYDCLDGFWADKVIGTIEASAIFT